METKNRKKVFIFLFILIAGVVFGGIAGAIFAVTSDFPQIRALETYRPPAVTRIYSADKKVLAELFVEKRDPVLLKDIPCFLKEAIVVTEDRSFYKHSGVDLKGILRAATKDILAGEFVEGASTITQQLAKTLFLTSKKTLLRKIKEAVLAFQLERRYTKDEILQMYLNQVYFGSGAYGVESAARIFFGKPAKDLSLSECALIAAMPKAPSRYSPLINKELALKRRNIVLKQMKDTGIITASACDEALKEPVVAGEQSKKESGAGYFVEYVKGFLEEVIGSARLYKGGLTVYTTLSFKLQKAAEDAVANGLIALEARMKSRGVKDPYPQGALIALDVRTGGILAMVGGRDFSKSPFNRAVSAGRQSGSAFKPVVYAYAIEQGFPQNMMMLDAPIAFKGAKNGKDWTPENFSGKYMGEITLRTALAVSENIPAVRLIEMLGSDSVARFSRNLGIESPLSTDLSLALGTSETTLIELTSAYAVFPNSGERIEPFGATEVHDGNGRIVWQVKPQKRAVMSRAGAAIMTDMLSTVIQEGTGRKARVIERPVAGKTGTTNQYKDALFIGFSPSIATGVWVGRDVNKTLGDLETGSMAALPIWIEFMTQSLADSPFQYFDIPDDVIKVRIDPVTGLRASDNSTHTATALFKKGTEPTQSKIPFFNIQNSKLIPAP
ncbi:MAG: PBP1A family penicillin-binding protein [Candidatus Desulfaltia sp.]|nr:PBP1A family penicillin-binding protein [Candidatus Desulfaltia sp.]